MSDPNPYSPPRTASDGDRRTAQYVRLGWRTAAASTAIGIAAVLSVTLPVLYFVVGPWKPEAPNVFAAVVITLIVFALGFSVIGASILFCIWLYRVARNVVGLGRVGMRFSPTWCVAWFFVPGGNLYKPVQVANELWLASDPDAAKTAWATSQRTALIPCWWWAWVAGSIGYAWINLFPYGGDTLQAGICLVAGGVELLAAIVCIIVMRRIDERQQRLAAKCAGTNHPSE